MNALSQTYSLFVDLEYSLKTNYWTLRTQNKTILVTLPRIRVTKLRLIIKSDCSPDRLTTNNEGTEKSRRE